MIAYSCLISNTTTGCVSDVKKIQRSITSPQCDYTYDRDLQAILTIAKHSAIFVVRRIENRLPVRHRIRHICRSLKNLPAKAMA